MIAVSARMTGTEAATSAPNVSARMSSVMPNDLNCELPSSALVWSAIDFSRLASPNCSMARPGVTRGDALGGVHHGLDPLGGGLGITLEVELDQRGAAVLGHGVAGDVGDDGLLGDRLGDVGDRGLEGGIVDGLGLALDEDHLRRLLLEAGVLVDLHAPCGCRRPASGRRSAVFWPTEPPIMNSAMIRPSHPKMAVLRWRALQCPARAAMPLGLGVMWGFPLLRGGSWSMASRIDQTRPLNRQSQQASAGSRSTQGRGRVDRE